MVERKALSASIGEQVRRRREQRGMTAAELARRAGLSKATLSGLEAGRGNPTVDTLDAIAQALAIPLADVLAAPDRAPTVLIHEPELSGEPIQQTLLQRIPGGHQVETWRLRMLPGASFDGVPHADGTREQLVLTRGSLTAGPTEEGQDLVAGDSLVFDGAQQHVYRAGADGADAVVILASPAIA